MTTKVTILYVKGLESARDSLTDETEKEKANSYIDSLKKDLNDNYIGIEQEENDVFDVTISKGNLTSADFSSNSDEAGPIQLKYETMTGQCSMKDFEVPKGTELFDNGKAAVSDLLSSNNAPLAQN